MPAGVVDGDALHRSPVRAGEGGLGLAAFVAVGSTRGGGTTCSTTRHHSSFCVARLFGDLLLCRLAARLVRGCLDPGVLALYGGDDGASFCDDARLHGTEFGVVVRAEAPEKALGGAAGGLTTMPNTELGR